MSFTFRDRMMNLNIAGVEFEIDARSGEELSRQKDELIGAGKAYQSGAKTQEETISFYAEKINKTLENEEAFAKIFKNRVPDVRDCLDIMTYIANEVTAFNRTSAFVEGMVDISLPNRVQRRAAAKS
jgi:hypothetical protein